MSQPKQSQVVSYHVNYRNKSYDLKILTWQKCHIQNSYVTCGVARRACVRPPRAATWIFYIKKLVFCIQQILRYWAKHTEIQWLWYCKFTIFIRGTHCDYSFRAPFNLATPVHKLLRIKYFHLINCFKKLFSTYIATVAHEWNTYLRVITAQLISKYITAWSNY